jgi:hypothetical protein
MRVTTVGYNGISGVEIVDSFLARILSEIAALSDGYTTGNGLGLGLGGARRLVRDFTIESTSRWDPADYPGADRHHPAILAALIWRDALRGNDDATVVVARASPENGVR